jgi:hypothetical protein
MANRPLEARLGVFTATSRAKTRRPWSNASVGKEERCALEQGELPTRQSIGATIPTAC